MAKQIASVEKSSIGGFVIRWVDGSCRTISANRDAVLLNYTNESITYKTNGRTIYFDFIKNSTRTL